jgi:translation elongation factor EF-Tu-like GTPase
MLELVEIEALELLEHYGYDPAKCPVIRGSALLALKGKLFLSYIPNPIKFIEVQATETFKS